VSATYAVDGRGFLRTLACGRWAPGRGWLGGFYDDTNDGRGGAGRGWCLVFD